MFASRPGDISIATSTLFKIVILGVLLFFLWTVRDILIVLLISITLASALEPMVDALSEKKIPRAVSVLAVYIFAIGFLAMIAYVLIPPVIQQFQQLAAGTTGTTHAASTEFLGSMNIGQIISDNMKVLVTELTNVSGDFFQRTVGVFNGAFQVITILVISFYLLAEKNGMKNFVYTIVPKAYEAEVLRIVNRIQRKIGFWLVGQLILSAIIFSLTLILLTALGVKYALALAILAGFLEIVPYLGPFISAIPAAAFAFLQSPSLALIVIISYIVIQKLEGYILVPKVMQKTTGLSPLVILVAILIGFKLAGIFGILLAVPLVATMNIIFNEWENIKNIKPAVQHHS